jgi:hypothetical protein
MKEHLSLLSVSLWFYFNRPMNSSSRSWIEKMCVCVCVCVFDGVVYV